VAADHLPLHAKENSRNTASLCSSKQGNHEIQMDTKGTNNVKKKVHAVTFKASYMLSKQGDGKVLLTSL